MKILSEENERLLIGMLTMQDSDSGIYIEREENKVPKKVIEATKKLGGYGVKSGNWFRSNTAGKTSEKFFERINDRVKFDIKNHEIIEDIKHIDSFEEGISILECGLGRTDLEFKLNCKQYDNIECTFKLLIKKDDYIVLKHDLESHKNFENIKDYFFGRDVVTIDFDLEIRINDLDRFVETVDTKKKHNKDSILNIIKQFSIINSKWYFDVDVNKYFYGNKDFQ